MMENLHTIGKLYTRMIMKNIGIFIFIGLLSVVTHDCGWFPNENMYAITQLVYTIVLPVLVAHEGGRITGGEKGGILAVLAVSGVLLSDVSVGILGAMLIGPLAGSLWKHEEKLIENRAKSSMQMLAKNLCIGITGSLLAAMGYYLFFPILSGLAAVIYRGVRFLAERQLTAFLGIMIEPAKVFFLNNLLNHAILVPLGMGQLKETGSSILFLLEANPGPGFGVLMAMYWKEKEKRSEYALSMAAEFAGGIHEVYFPVVLSNVWLFLPLILGGVAGNICFGLLDAGAKGAVSPGSIFILLLMAGKGALFPAAAGVALSALVSFAGSLLVLKKGRRHPTAESYPEKEEMQMEVLKTEKQGKISRVVFVCDGGVGSSAMGAALFRRTMAQKGMTGVQVEAFAADLIPEEAELLVCQKDFAPRLAEGARQKEVYTVESLVRAEEYAALTEWIQKRNG